MALAKSLMIFSLVMPLLGVCFGTVYKVGDSEGWRYKDFNDGYAWRADKKFTVGDSLLFVYKAGKDNVMQVERKHYQTCNITDPINVTRSGDDTITLDKPGHFFYISGYNANCFLGERLDIRVSLPTSPSPSSSPSPSPSSSPSPSQSPHKSSAPSLQSSAVIPAILMAMAVHGRLLH